MTWEEGPIRLSARPRHRRGALHGDDVVTRARHLVESTWLTQREIAARIGVSHMSVSRWARAGGWFRPFGLARPSDAREMDVRARARSGARLSAWRLLRQAEALLALSTRNGTDIDGLERALALVLDAKALHERPPSGARPRSRALADGSTSPG